MYLARLLCDGQNTLNCQSQSVSQPVLVPISLCLAHLGPVSWRPTTVKWRQFSQSNRHPTIGTGQTEYQEALPPSANVQSHLTSSFTDDGNASWYTVCRVPMVEWRLDCENCRHLTVVGLHDTGPCCVLSRTRWTASPNRSVNPSWFLQDRPDVVKCMRDKLVCWLADWLADYLIGWLVDWLVGWLTSWLANCLCGWLVNWLVDWLVVPC